MIHIADTKVARRYGDFFIRQIHKFDEVSFDILSNDNFPLQCEGLHNVVRTYTSTILPHLLVSFL